MIKQERRDSEAHLANLRRLECCVCGEPPPNTVHHLKAGRLSQGKSEDARGVPLCMFGGEHCHEQVEAAGSKNERQWFLDRGVDPDALADALWDTRANLDAMKAVMRKCWCGACTIVRGKGRVQA